MSKKLEVSRGPNAHLEYPFEVRTTSLSGKPLVAKCTAESLAPTAAEIARQFEESGHPCPDLQLWRLDLGEPQVLDQLEAEEFGFSF